MSNNGRILIMARIEDSGVLALRIRSPKATSTEPTPAPEFKYATRPPSPSLSLTISFREPSKLVTIYVGRGPAVKEFLVHKELLCKHSPVFAAGLNSNFKEGLTQTWRLEDTSEGAFV